MTTRSRRGTTLIEILIYSALLAIFIGATFSFVASILGSTDTLLERNEIVTTAEFIEKKIGWLALQASTISVPFANGSSSTVTIMGSDATLFPATFAWDGVTLTLALPSVAEAPLINPRVEVTSFLAEHFSTAQTSSTLRVSFAVRSSIYPHLITTSTSYYAIHE